MRHVVQRVWRFTDHLRAESAFHDHVALLQKGKSSLFAFCTGAVILSALLILGTFLLNIFRFPEGKNHREIKHIVFCEVLLSIVLLIPFWTLWERVIEFLDVMV